jgi:hypothetical protein
MIKNIFTKEVAAEVINRINQLKPIDKPVWGKMSADQMLAHCNVSYALTFETESFNKPNAFKKFLLKFFVKNFVVGDKPYPKNGRTAPEFTIAGQKDFEKEKAKLIENIEKAQKLGMDYFEGKDNFSFGKMTGKEWSTMFYKHLDHHLSQFGV